MVWYSHLFKNFPQFLVIHTVKGFPDSSVGKISACNAGDPGSIPGLGISAGEGIYCIYCINHMLY